MCLRSDKPIINSFASGMTDSVKHCEYFALKSSDIVTKERFSPPLIRGDETALLQRAEARPSSYNQLFCIAEVWVLSCTLGRRANWRQYWLEKQKLLHQMAVSADPVIIPWSRGESPTSLWTVISARPWYHYCSFPTYPSWVTQQTNMSQMTDKHMITFLLNAFWCGYWLCVFIQALQWPCKDGQCLIWHKICQGKNDTSKMFYCIWTNRVNLYWMIA